MAASRAQQEKLTNISTRVMDAAQLDLDDKTFDVYVNGIDCPLNIASTVGFIRIPEPVSDVLAHT